MRILVAQAVILVHLVFLKESLAQQVGSIYTWDHFVALVEKIERHKLAEHKSLKVIANYIRKLGYDDNKWTTLLGHQSESLPNGILTPTEKTILTNMINHRFNGQTELGVVHTPFGDVAMGHVILGICAGIKRKTDLVLTNSTNTRGDNLHLATIAGDLGLTTLVKKLTSKPLLGPGGIWTPSNQCPETLDATSQHHSKATDAQILGGIDGFVLGSKIRGWSSRGVRLGQLLRMYYQDGVVYDKNYAACRRREIFENIDTVKNDLSDQVALSAFAVKYVWNNNLGLPYNNVRDMEIPALANNSVQQFYTYARNLQNRQSSCKKGSQDGGCMLSANIVFVLDESGSIGAANYEVEKDFVQKVIGAFDISPYSVRVAVVEYASYAQETITLEQYSSKSPLVCAVGRLSFASGGTATSIALQTAFNVLQNASAKATKDRENDPKILILLTDGHSNGGIPTLTPVVESIKKSIKGLTMVAVGVGGYNLAELQLIATDPNKHVLTTSDFSQLISLVNRLRKDTCETATVLEPKIPETKPQGPQGKNTYDVKISLYVGPGKTRYFKIPSETLVMTERLSIHINASFGAVSVYISRKDSTPGPDSYDSKYEVSADQHGTRRRRSADGGRDLIFTKLCQGNFNGTCPPLYIAVVGQNSSNACSDRDCSVPNQIKVEINAEYSGHCMKNPCTNGTCVAQTNGYYCKCFSGHIGSRCHATICDSLPCRHGGTCHENNNGYSCECLQGYAGRRCEIDLKTNVTCDPKFMEVQLTRSYFTHIDSRNLHLSDPACRVVRLTSKYIYLRTLLSGCGTNHTEENDKIDFWNYVNADNRYMNPNQTIIRNQKKLVRFHCKFARRQLVSTSFSPSKHTVHVSDENFGNFTFTMNLFKSTNYRDSYLPFEYPVVVTINQPLWIEFTVKNAMRDLVVFADNCRATTSTNPNSSPQYEFLKSGCALDPTMSYNYDPKSSVQRFSIKSFRFIHDNNKLVYLHCEMLVCHKDSDNSRCSRGCIAARKRRAADTFEDTSNPASLSVGPFSGENDNAGGNTKSTNDDESGTHLIMVTSLVVVGTLLLLVSGLFIAFRIKSRRRRARRPAGPVAVNSYENEGTADCTDEKKESCEMQAKI